MDLHFPEKTYVEVLIKIIQSLATSQYKPEEWFSPGTGKVEETAIFPGEIAEKFPVFEADADYNLLLLSPALLFFSAPGAFSPGFLVKKIPDTFRVGAGRRNGIKTVIYSYKGMKISTHKR
jgi:hypothetical protein